MRWNGRCSMLWSCSTVHTCGWWFNSDLQGTTCRQGPLFTCCTTTSERERELYNRYRRHKHTKEKMYTTKAENQLSHSQKSRSRISERYVSDRWGTSVPWRRHLLRPVRPVRGRWFLLLGPDVVRRSQRRPSGEVVRPRHTERKLSEWWMIFLDDNYRRTI